MNLHLEGGWQQRSVPTVAEILLKLEACLPIRSSSSLYLKELTPSMDSGCKHQKPLRELASLQLHVVI